ncbi:MAG: hypothetical protein AAFX99_08510, partial [Myxococcota bacterium]
MSTLLNRIHDAYSRYGYTHLDIGEENAQVYTKKIGLFQLAEILRLTSNAPYEEVRKELERSGYLTRHQEFISEQVLLDTLFQSHFQLLSSRRELENRSKRFKNGLSAYLGSDYKYVPAPFQIFSEQTPQNNTVVSTIIDLFKQNGPQLIFLEAAAGFGKTCTAFEVLESLLDERDDWLPILTELQYNRKAKLFRYVLLDEIDKQFNLPSELVASEIKLGRLPLVIDGFDELILQKPQGIKDEVDFTHAEAMLDTISSLLDNQSKVLITTRRTALFSGAEFEDWLEQLEQDGCKVHRIELDAPRPADWLGKVRETRLMQTGVPILNLANPVLFSYLRNLPEVEFDSISQTPSKVVSHFFTALLERETKRQDLRIKVQEQLKLLRCIARNMLKNDTKHVSPDQIRDSLMADSEIILIIDESCALYGGEDALTREDFISKLLVHALL